MASSARQPNPQKDIQEITKKAIKDSLTILDRRFTEEISAVKWDWPYAPKIRDIVNTGQLRASQLRIEREDGVTYKWPVEYAEQVHDGMVLRDGNITLPGRPWTKAPLEEFSTLLNELLEERLKKA